MIAVVVFVLQRQVVVLKFLEFVLLVEPGDLLLQTVIGLDSLDTAPADQQNDHHKQHLPGEADIAQALDKAQHQLFVYRCLFA